MKKFAVILLSLNLLLLNSCDAETETVPETPTKEIDHEYQKALKLKAKIDSVNASLGWTEIKFGLWQSNQGDLGIFDLRMIYMDSLLMVEDYITKIDTIPLKSLVDTSTFKSLNNLFYKDDRFVYHLYPMAYGSNFHILEEADVATFHILGSCYAKDKNHIYTEKGMILNNVDYETFFTTKDAGCFAADKDNYYFWDEQIDLDGQLDSLTLQRIELLKAYRNAMDTVYSSSPDWTLNASTGKTKVKFDQFYLKINSFFETNKIHSDTTVIYEDVGEYLYGRDLIIQPKNEEDTFHLYLCSIDHVIEMIPSDSIGAIWDEDSVWNPLQLIDTSDYFYWKPTQKPNHYIFPNIGYNQGKVMQTRVKELGFRDTTYWYHGEFFGTFHGEAWLHEGRIVNYMIYTAFVKIERHNNGLQDTKWLQLEFSYGC